MRQTVLLALFAILLAACVSQVVVTQPQLMLHVHNDDGEVIPADVTLYWWEYPYRRQRAVTVVATNDAGIAAFAEKVKTETAMPLVLHGVPAYNWSFCVEAEGYKTLIGTVSNAKPGEPIEAELILHRGESLSVCADYDRLHNHPGTPINTVDFSGGEIDGVYEVGAVN